MYEALLTSFGGGFLAYLFLSGFQELRLWRCAVAIKKLQEAHLSDVRTSAARKRWDTDKELQELKDAVTSDRFGVNEPDDKWAGLLDRGPRRGHL